MQFSGHFHAFNTRRAIITSHLLPVRSGSNSFPLCCSNCNFINHRHFHFCTNCGYPVHPQKDNLAIYNMRLQRRKALEKSCEVQVLQARNALYILAAILMIGLFYLFSDTRQTIIKGVVMLVLGVLYAGLGRWSLYKPFTSLLIGLMIVLTFTAISTWTEFSVSSTGFNLFYTLFIQSLFIYFLWQGVKGAFRADMLEEESKL